MNSNPINSLITIAITHLKTHPFDAAHDLAHHKRVWQNAQKIANHLSHQTPSIKINLNALKLACFWHDVVIDDSQNFSNHHRSHSSAEYLAKAIAKHHLNPDLIHTTLLAVKYHEYDDRPQNIEGQILWDADKLDVISLDRWLIAQKAFEAGQLSQTKYDSYTQTGAVWLKTLRSKFFFDITRELYDQSLTKLLQNPHSFALAQSVGVDLSSLLNHDK